MLTTSTEAASIAHPSANLSRSARRYRRYHRGSSVQSLNRTIRQISQPPVPNAWVRANVAKENRNAFPKHRIGSTDGKKETAKAESRKGNMEVSIKRTIDTVPKSAPRIIGRKLPEARPRAIPQASPPIQHSGRKNRPEPLLGRDRTAAPSPNASFQSGEAQVLPSKDGRIR